MVLFRSPLNPQQIHKNKEITSLGTFKKDIKKENVQVDLISHIPDEIKLLIFQHLDSFSVITLDEVSKKFAEVSLDKKLSSNLCFNMDYRFKFIHLQSFLLDKPRKEIITSLNINCVYWIPRSQMIRCLSLPMLKSLYALDTKLELIDICQSNLANLNVLAITITYRSGSYPFSGMCVIKNLKKLYIQYDRLLRINDLNLTDIYSDLISLEELWLLDIYKACLHKFDINKANSLKRFVIKSNASIFTLIRTGFNAVTFKSARGGSNICIEKTSMNISKIYEHDFYEGLENVIWATYLNELKCDYPFGLHDAKKLVYKQETLDSLYFQELSLDHTPGLCCEKLQSTVVSILALPNTKLLRKLSINICIFCDHSKISDIYEPLFKRRRTTKLCINRSILDVIVEHLPLIEELEILRCNSYRMTHYELNPDVLRPIGKLSKLKSLVLFYISNIDNGRYLLDICKSCTNLTSLKIWSSQNSDLSNHLCMSIPYLRMLKDLQYEDTDVRLNRILESLASNVSHKLERVVLFCYGIETISSEPLKKFITQNPQLKFLHISVPLLSEAAVKHISQNLNEMKSDQQIFVVQNSPIMDYSLPLVHRLEMLEFNTSVGVIHPFNDFH